MVQSSDVPLSSSTRSVQESQLSPEAAGKPVDSRATPDSATKPPERGVPKETASPRQPKPAGGEDSEKEAKRLLDEEEERRKLRRRKKGRIRELEEIRAELAEKELVLLSKEQELLERDQTVNVLREEVKLLFFAHVSKSSQCAGEIEHAVMLDICISTASEITFGA